MKGFTDKCLLIFPKPESYEFREERYHSSIRKAVNNLVAYMSAIGVELYCMSTDEVSLMVNPAKVKWIQTLSEPDDFFMRSHNQAMTGLKYKEIIKEPELYLKANEKFKLERGLTPEQRFELIVKRERLTSKAIIDKHKLVIMFNQPNNPSYVVTKKEGDGKLRIFINNNTFIPECYLSGELIDANDLLQLTGANRPVFSWEVDKWLI